ncbi:hypothetical protein L1987_09119 [Smallanthus sonchifolius]|uniref:Uncharacterized protein n=1 Tax=Smallanthus sonchifolius TaxID=185202 RepID=A0ACB9JP48_9ASTR|nr:hypothetical protein L1987_09119 [Smallanthus sonchifolius]
MFSRKWCSLFRQTRLSGYGGDGTPPGLTGLLGSLMAVPSFGQRKSNLANASQRWSTTETTWGEANRV